VRVSVPAAILLCIAGCCYHAPSTLIPPGPLPPLGTGIPPVPNAEPTIRVRLAAGKTALLSSDRGLTILSGTARRSVAPSQPVPVGLDGSQVVAAGGSAPLRTSDTLVVVGNEGSFVRVGDRSYRGRMLVFRSADGDLAVVNVLGLEDYLFGVVPCEIGPINARTLEAAKAQAVAARSFTMSRLGRRKGLGHDVFDSYARDQEYRGLERETDLSRQAVATTRGEVIVFGDEVCEALYHGNCGGVTANGSKPYLKSVPDTPGHRRGGRAYCSGRPNSTWQASFTRESLDAVASKLSGKKCHVRTIALETDRQSGRVRCLGVTTDRGRDRLPASNFRVAAGLRSTAFTADLRTRTVCFTGRGWGHGVGMCQDGAVAMAESGANYRQILEQYYSGVSLTKRY
jgi:stage II sporulation protein D